MPSNPLPSSARSALREAAANEIEAQARFDALTDDHPQALDLAQLALIDAQYAYSRSVAEPHVILALLSLAERGAEDTKRLATLRRVLDSRGGLTFTVWGSEQVSADEMASDVGPRDSLDDLLDAIGEKYAEIDAFDRAAHDRLAASSPTGGTTE